MSTKAPKCNCYHSRSLHAAEVRAEAADTHAREVEEALTEEFRLHAETRAELAALRAALRNHFRLHHPLLNERVHWGACIAARAALGEP